ncbi:MAG: hypothetical protein CMO80_03125 [Verrucomicrobiales bacterium]|nr:hypothetical protein [Verrucomicrobiales bacterium]
MNRREFLLSTSAALAVAPNALARRPKRPKLLSEQGCGRATGYAEANKIVTIGDLTHVTWLDSPSEGFRVRIATLNRKTNEWSRTYTVGDAFDNHGGPALTVDAEGYLHITYYTHHHPFRYRRSKRPNDASEWEEEMQFGDRLTYPTMLCGSDGTLYFTARRSYSDRPWTVEMWKKPAGKDWEQVGSIMYSRHKGYAHFQESLCWGPDHKTIHLSCRFHELTDKGAYGRFNTVAYMKSEDFGKTWRRANGDLIEGSITAEKMDVIDRGGENFNRTLRVGCIAADKNNQPWILYSAVAKNRGNARLTRADPKGQWNATELAPNLPPAWRNFNFIMAGGLAFDSRGELHGVGQLQNGERNEKEWGDPTNEIAKFQMSKEGAFEFRALSEFDSKTSHWLPSIERPTGFNQLRHTPGVIYTGGPPGGNNKELLANRVYWNA